jgi:hypothetical protein
MHVYVDESARSLYLMCAVSVSPSRLKDARKAMRDLCRPGQRRIHMVKERDSRRREILDEVALLG